MSVVAVAIVGSAVVGGVVANNSAKRGAKAAEAGAATAAEATVQSTQMQIDEIRRQFDYQQQVLMPRIQQQYGAMGMQSELLGITPASMPQQIEGPQQQQQGGNYFTQGSTPIPMGPNAGPRDYNYRPQNQVISNAAGAAAGRDGAVPIATQTPTNAITRGSQGEFVDPNLRRTRLADTETLSGTIQNNRMAGTSAEDDPFRNYITENRIAARTAEEDARFQRARDVTMTGTRGGVSLADERGGVSLADERGDVRLAGDTLQGDEYYQDVAGRSLAAGAAGTGVYGDEFQTSPGYSFAVEEMGRELDRRNSAGGNYGGRAIMEAERRAQGLANQEYYNWAAGRTSDLQRRAGAEAQDAGRLDYAGQNYFARQATDVARGDSFAATDIARGDQFAATDIARGDSFAGADISRADAALDAYEGQRIADVGRDDQAYLDYQRRREGDAARMDSAAANVDRLQAADLARSDQAYYNYLQQLSMMAGGGDAVGTAVNASQAAGGQVAGAYSQQGGQLSSIYNNLGINQAQIEAQRGANVNNAMQSGFQNYFTWRDTA